MPFNGPTLFTCAIVSLGTIVAMPVLIKGFRRRGTGVRYERNFLIQRAPQLASLINVVLITMAFFFYVGVLPLPPWGEPFFVLATSEPSGLAAVISWLGVALLTVGMVFMVGGWYSLGEAFSTDAEVLKDQKVKRDGLLQYVMHPIYSGIIQSLLGAALAATSLVGVFFALFIVAPLWLSRAKYEEKILTESLGPSYQEYAESMHWRRLIPVFFPLGI